MDISGADHTNTHAIIGGGKAEVIDIHNDARVMMSMTMNLYTFPMVAAIREPICNAWDEHVKYNVKRPIEIQVTDEELIITDFAKGIPHDKVKRIYGTLGLTTKELDPDQTGGFGFGSKAPMAYTTNFTVENRHDGQKSIRNFSRGSEETNGAPDTRLITIVPDPTNETGITVRIPLADANDREEVLTIAKEICWIGGINAKINGRTFKVFDYEKSVSEGMPFVIVPMARIPAYLRKSVNHYSADYHCYVKTGAVIYPITPETFNRQSVFSNYSLHRSRNPKEYAVIFLAPGDTISMTPSREALNMVQLTKDTLNDLYDQAEKVVKEIKESVESKIVKMFEVNIDNYNIHKSIASFIGALSAYHNPTYFISECRKNNKEGVVNSLSEYSPSKVTNKDQLIDLICALTVHSNDKLNAIVESQEITKDDKDCVRRESLRYIKTHYPYIYPTVRRDIQASKILCNRYANSYNYSITYDTRNVYVTQSAYGILRMMKSIDSMPGVDCFLNTAPNLGERSNTSTFEKMLPKVSDKSKYNIRSDIWRRILSDLCVIHNSTQNRDRKIVIAQSNASIDRVIKKGIVKNITKNEIYIYAIARKKADYLTLKKKLQDEWGCTNLVFVPDFDKIEQEQKIEERFLFNAISTEPKYKDHYTVVLDKEPEKERKFFIMNPYDYMWRGTYRKNHSKSKISLSDNALFKISEIYPDLVLCPNAKQASLMEKEGMTNVLLDLHNRCRDWINDPKNTETLCQHSRKFGVYARHSSLSMILETLTVSDILEALGKNPTHSKSTELPDFMSAMLLCFDTRKTPKCGMQYIDKIGVLASNTVMNYFGPDINAATSSEFFRDFYNIMSSKAIRDPDHPSRFLARSALLSAIQTAMMYIKLEKMSEK